MITRDHKREIDVTVSRCEDWRLTNKNPCKSYKSEHSANIAAGKLSVIYGSFYDRKGEKMKYHIALVPSWGRYIIVFDMTEMAARPEFRGGYIGQPANDGHWMI